ncbi:protein-glutamate O-methyltransferase CheR [Sphingomonas lacunae]|uniref:Protein-glutamate O-methyltransferase CheR n=1 Tax=Sphingomonas lacunae TaxID=2698828 RepID=A0A6M4AX66_9SPHN|nr:protein-glutamate O-methyltransferase CheR [Sphingomonas lacunae]
MLAALLEARAGHALSPERMWRIETVLHPILRERGYPSLEALVVALASEADRNLVDQVVDALINHETYFFRDHAQFLDIERVALECLRERRTRHRTLSVWSVGCSTGQEPYSLAMALAERPEHWAGWDINILATDISPSVIRTARAGRYSHFEIQRGLPTRLMLRWFEPDGSDWLLRGDIRDRVRFAEHNLLSDTLPPGPFDLILCRNMLFYLTPEHRSRAVTRLAAALAPDGLFMLGAFETMLTQGAAFAPDPEARGFYRLSAAEARPQGRLQAR